MKKTVVFLIATMVFVSGCWPTDDEKVPAAPTELVGTIVTTNFGRGVRLSWKDNSNNETGFNIVRGYSEVKTTFANTTTWVDYPPDTQYGITYTYKVRSVTNYNVSAYSNEVVITFM